MECRNFYGGHKLLVANRGEIAVRIIRTAKALGIATAAVYSTSDALSPHVSLADEAVLLKATSQPFVGEPESKLYLSSSAIIAVCKDRHATMVHPGYGFLSENADFAQAVVDAGIIWLGPRPDVIRAMGLKHEARDVATKAGLPLVPGSQGLVSTPEDALRIAREIGFPVMLKATAGGGGMGLVVCNDETELSARFTSTKERAETLFRHEGVFIERYYPSARHIEVQVFGNGIGNVIHMGERECSVQRRHQKVIEETPSPFFSRYPRLREEMCGAAVRLCRSIKYSSSGTVEFLVDDETGEFFFLEMNTRIQVEHPITEVIHPGLDLIELMIAQGVAERTTNRGLNLDSSTLSQGIFDANLNKCAMHVIEARIYSENPAGGFKPCSGVLQHVDLPEEAWLRVDHWISTGTNVTTFFDPLLCKFVVRGNTREEAVLRLQQALSSSRSSRMEEATTTFLDTFAYTPRAMTVVSGGIETSVQDLPGRRVGLGIPPSGPMDAQAFMAANCLVGNHLETEGLEIVTLPRVGCKFTFHVPCVVAVTGKAVTVKVDRKPAPMWGRLVIPAKGTLEVGGEGRETSNGFRVYLAVRGGFPEVPQYLGSKSTSIGLGGYQEPILFVLSTALIPVHPKDWVVNVLPGPQDDDEYLTPEGNETFYSTQWSVSSSSNRMGIRLQSKIGIQWARPDGGEGGSHPSNILDNGYALGTVNLNGDTPVILTQDGPDMGGYICACTVVSGDLWKLGQLSPGIAQTSKKWIEDVQSAVSGNIVSARAAPNFATEINYASPILQRIVAPAGSPRPTMTFRQAGDSAILIEYGQMKLDFELRARVHALETEAHKRKVNGMESFAACVRSALCRFDPDIISQTDFLNFLVEVENTLPDTMVDVEFPGRKITFPSSSTTNGTARLWKGT
ncbi:putative urea carboxylase [Chiua virens]|nr:putative urea carboxylase [Chiua virens]